MTFGTPVQVTQKWLKMWLFPKEKALSESLLSHFYRRAKSHFCVTFGVTLIIWGFGGGGSRGHGGSQLWLVPCIRSQKNVRNPNHHYPKDPSVLKILRVVNLLRVVFLVRRGDLLSRRTLCGRHFPGNYRHFSSPRRVRGVVNWGA